MSLQREKGQNDTVIFVHNLQNEWYRLQYTCGFQNTCLTIIFFSLSPIMTLVLESLPSGSALLEAPFEFSTSAIIFDEISMEPNAH